MNPLAVIALNKAKIDLMSKKNTVFFTTILFSLEMVWDNSVPYAATNGRILKLNSDFFEKAPIQERSFTLLHEVYHVALQHIGRAETRNKKKWNIACDFVVNGMIADSGIPIPDWVFYDAKFRGMTAEKVYQELPDEIVMDAKAKFMDIEEPDEPIEKFKDNINKVLVRAAMQSKMSTDEIGTIPGEINFYLDGLLNPKLPWERLLQKYMNKQTKSDYSFARPNRRHFPQFHLPSPYSTGICDLSIAVDISGSVSDNDFKSIISEVYAIFRMQKPEKITLIQFDTEIQHIDTIQNLQDLKNVTFTGRGGTHVDCVFDWAKKNKPQILLVFSDGYFDIPENPYKGELLWLVYDNPGFAPGFGHTIHYEMNNNGI